MPKVREVMTPDPATASPSMTVVEAAKEMIKKEKGPLPVVEGGRVVAMVTLVFLADLTVELRAWPTDTWTKVGIDPQAAAAAVVAGWQRGDLPGCGWAR